jgi:hypothetical protein
MFDSGHHEVRVGVSFELPDKTYTLAQFAP